MMTTLLSTAPSRLPRLPNILVVIDDDYEYHDYYDDDDCG